MKCLIISSPYPGDITLDPVYDGLCELYGDTNVVEYPFNPMYHNKTIENCETPNYCLDRKDHGFRTYKDIEDVANDFDFVIVGTVDDKTIKHWLGLQEKFAGKPIAWINGADSFNAHYEPSMWPLNVSHTHRFLREYVSEFDQRGNYNTQVYPLPSTFVSRIGEIHVPFNQATERDIIFSSTLRMNHEVKNAIRKTYHQLVESSGFTPHDYKSYFDYAPLLNRSRMSLSIRGGGYDTARFWEILYYGAVLVTPKYPNVIPNPFPDECIIHIKSPGDMISKVREYARDEHLLKQMAEKSRQHLLKYHTSVSRAKYILEKMELI